MNLAKLEPTKELCVFFVCTENEIINEDLESTLSNYLNTQPSSKYKIDLYLYLNKVIDKSKVGHIKERISKNIFVNKVEFYSLDLSEHRDVFWYPWSKMPKPYTLPEYGYTSGANVLFYESIDDMMNKEEGYKNFLMLEADSEPLCKNWFDILVNYCKKNKFEIAGSTYKGDQQVHKESKYKDHLNGIALYRNNEKLKKILKGGREVIKKELPKSGFLNFDVANYIFYKRNEGDFGYKNISHIVNVSDPRDSFMSNDLILEKNPEAVIVHKKKTSERKKVDPSIFHKNGLKDIPVCILNQYCGSEYIKSTNLEIARELSKKDFIYSMPVCFKIKTPLNSHIYINCICKEKLLSFPNNFFENIDGDIREINFFNFAKVFENNYIHPISILVDIRFSKKIDISLWDHFHSLLFVIKRSPYTFSFWKDIFDLASSHFNKHEIKNFHQKIQGPNRENALKNFMKKDFESNFFLNSFFEDSLYNIKDEEINELVNSINIFDITLIDQVTWIIYKQTYDFDVSNIPFKRIRHNPSIDKLIIDKNSLDPKILNYIQNKHSIYENIYNKCVFKKLEEPQQKTGELNKIPLIISPDKEVFDCCESSLLNYFSEIKGSGVIQTVELEDMKGCSVIASCKTPRKKKISSELMLNKINQEDLAPLCFFIQPKDFKKNYKTTFRQLQSLLSEIGLNTSNNILSLNPASRASIRNWDLDFLRENKNEISPIIRFFSDAKSKDPITFYEYDIFIDFIRDNEIKVSTCWNVKNDFKKILEPIYGLVFEPHFLKNEKNIKEKNKLPEDVLKEININSQWERKFISNIKDFCVL